jgi:hypothetical protein
MMRIIEDALYSFWRDYASMQYSIDEFYRIFWAENQIMSQRIARFSAEFEIQNKLIQSNIATMQAYVQGRIAAMSTGSGYGTGVTEYVAPVPEEEGEAEPNRNRRLLSSLVVIAVLATVGVAIINKSITGRAQQ